jgi:hypothetical protein
MQTATELIVHLQADRPGALVSALEALGRTGINVEGLSELEGVLHVLTRDAGGATRALRSAGIRVHGERVVSIVRVEDRPGAAAAMLRRLAAAGVIVDFCYLATDTRLVIGTDDPEAIARVLA